MGWPGKLRRIALLILVLGAGVQCSAQTTSSAPPPPEKAATVPTSSAERQISWKLFLPNVIHDQKPIWLFPKSLAEGKHVKPTMAVLVVTGDLIALDPIVSPYSAEINPAPSTRVSVGGTPR